MHAYSESEIEPGSLDHVVGFPFDCGAVLVNQNREDLQLPQDDERAADQNRRVEEDWARQVPEDVVRSEEEQHKPEPRGYLRGRFATLYTNDLSDLNLRVFRSLHHSLDRSPRGIWTSPA